MAFSTHACGVFSRAGHNFPARLSATGTWKSPIDDEEDDYLIFGNETQGLPDAFIRGNPAIALTIPLWNNTRSLNLSNAVAIMLYEALRQVRRF